MCHLRRTYLSGKRSHIDNASPARGDHVRQNTLHDQIGCLEVDLHDPVPACIFYISKKLETLDRGVIDNDRNGPQSGPDVRHGSFYGGAIRHIAMNGHGTSALLLQGRRDTLGIVAMDIEHGYRHPSLGKPVTDRFSNTRAAAGDHGYAFWCALHFHCCYPLILFLHKPYATVWFVQAQVRFRALQMGSHSLQDWQKA